MSGFTQVTENEPCEVCGKPDWCQRGPGYIQCMRHNEHPSLGTGTEKQDSRGETFWYWSTNSQETARREISQSDSEPSCEICQEKADDETLNRVYSAFLNESPLLNKHTQKLVKRGLTMEEADQFKKLGYRSLWDRGRAEIVKNMIRKGVPEMDIAKTPGFCIVEYKGTRYWTTSRLIGMLIPVRNSFGQIVAVQCRLDEPSSSGKYKAFSSKKRGGSSPGSPVHYPLFDGDTSTIRVTEGYLKADIATLKTGVLTIGLPGVGSWKRAAAAARRVGAQNVLVAYDADHRTNRKVRTSLTSLTQSLRNDFNVRMELWT